MPHRLSQVPAKRVGGCCLIWGFVFLNGVVFALCGLDPPRRIASAITDHVLDVLEQYKGAVLGSGSSKEATWYHEKESTLLFACLSLTGT